MLNLFNQKNIIRWHLFIVATFFLLSGTVIYLFFYTEKFNILHIPFYDDLIVPKLTIESKTLLVFFQSFTTYTHIIFMTLYCTLLSQTITMKTIWHWALLWGLIDTIFELGQLLPASNNTEYREINPMTYIFQYFEAGTFDAFDLLAIILGIISIGFFGWISQKSY